MESRAKKAQELLRLLEEAPAAGDESMTSLEHDLDHMHDDMKAEKKALDKIHEIIEGKKKKNEVNGDKTEDEHNGDKTGDEHNGDEDGLMVEVVQDEEGLVQPLVNEMNKLKIIKYRSNNNLLILLLLFFYRYFFMKGVK